MFPCCLSYLCFLGEKKVRKEMLPWPLAMSSPWVFIYGKNIIVLLDELSICALRFNALTFAAPAIWLQKQ